MKQVVIEKPVRDVDGLLKALRSATPPFDALSVASDPKRTYVYLQSWEENDPTPLVKAWEDIPELSVSIVGNQGPDGIYEALADGMDAHTLLIRKLNAEGQEIGGNETLRVEVPDGVEVSPPKPVLSEGQVMVKIGPASSPTEFQASVLDYGKRMRSVTIRLRFVGHAPSGEPIVQKDPPKRGFLAILKRLIGGVGE
jgi:hypothetical protein